MANLLPTYRNLAEGTIQAGSSAIGSASATGITVASGEGAAFGPLGTNQYLPAWIVDPNGSGASAYKECVWITARSTDALTIVRQAEDSTRFPASTSTIQAGYVIAAVASRQGLLGPANMTADLFNQALAWSHDPIYNVGTFQPTSNSLNLVAIPVMRDMTINAVTMVTSSAASTPTSGRNWFGLYDAAGNRLGVSSDLTTPIATAGVITASLTSAVTVSSGPGYIYGAFLITASTMPFFFRTSTSTSASYQAALDFNAATNAHRAMKDSVGNTLPSTVTLSTFSATVGACWMCLT